MTTPKFRLGDLVRKRSGSEWKGRIVGTYSTSLTPEGYAVESDAHPGSVQIYPAAALEHTHGAPAREWRELSDEELLPLVDRAAHAGSWIGCHKLARAIEAALREKNA